METPNRPINGCFMDTQNESVLYTIYSMQYIDIYYRCSR